MKIIRTFLPGSGVRNFFGLLITFRTSGTLSNVQINHHRIHSKQAKDSGGWLPYYIKSAYYNIKYGRRLNPLEKEAKTYELDQLYVARRWLRQL